MWRRVIGHAAERSMELSINIQDAWNLFQRQNGKCALSGVDIYLPQTSDEAQGSSATASLDRVDSDKGYIPGNVQWVHKDVNLMKMELKQKSFIHWCKLIASHCATEFIGSPEQTNRRRWSNRARRGVA
jgi:hypothetical protein